MTNVCGAARGEKKGKKGGGGRILPEFTCRRNRNKHIYVALGAGLPRQGISLEKKKNGRGKNNSPSSHLYMILGGRDRQIRDDGREEVFLRPRPRCQEKGGGGGGRMDHTTLLREEKRGGSEMRRRPSMKGISGP